MNIEEVAQKKSQSLITNYSMASLCPLNDGEEYHMHNETGTGWPWSMEKIDNYNYSLSYFDLFSLCSSSECKVIRSFAFLICFFGLVGNGMVIWLLGFHMKRNNFTTFILNLAVADFGVLIFIVIDCTLYIIFLLLGRNTILRFYSWLEEILLISIFLFFHLTGQFLLTAISIDRCVSVLFPIWHRCHRPTYLSTTVCAFLWVASFLFCLISIILIAGLLCIMFVVSSCLLLMIISSLILFIKVCFKSPKNKRGKALTAIFLTLFFFFIFAFPVLVCLLIINHVANATWATQYSILSASLNSSVNPFIYFLVGRQKEVQRREKMKNILQRLFKEEEGHGAFMDSPV